MTKSYQIIRYESSDIDQEHGSVLFSTVDWEEAENELQKIKEVLMDQQDNCFLVIKSLEDYTDPRYYSRYSY